MCGLVVVEHEVDGVRGGADENDLEDSVVEGAGLVEGPQQVDVSREVDNEVEELRLERDTGRALRALLGMRVASRTNSAYAGRFHLVQQDQDGEQVG
jgi:hypothetical protein